jgi:hypothetical protein
MKNRGLSFDVCNLVIQLEIRHVENHLKGSCWHISIYIDVKTDDGLLHLGDYETELLYNVEHRVTAGQLPKVENNLQVVAPVDRLWLALV